MSFDSSSTSSVTLFTDSSELPLPGHELAGQEVPEGYITEWSTADVADFIDGLGLRQYHEVFMGMSALY